MTYWADVTLFLDATSGGLSLTVVCFFFADFLGFIALNAILAMFSDVRVEEQVEA